MSIADNLFLGHEHSRVAWLDRVDARRRARQLLARVGLQIDPDTTVGDLPISARQLIEITKALALKARIIVMDEPTSALNKPEVDNLFARIDDLNSQQCGIIYITHRLDEIYAVADRISILRDGQLVATRAKADLPDAELVRLMVGRPLRDQAPRRRSDIGKTGLAVERCTVRAVVRDRPPIVADVSFDVQHGEVLGLVGLEGSGASELLWAIFGALGRRAGMQLSIDGHGVNVRSPRHAIENGIALVTNDRKRTGLILDMDIIRNTTLASLPRLSRWGWLRRSSEESETNDAARQLHLGAASLRQRVATLSGGSQQKVVLAKWMNTRPRILLLDEPTRGIDVGAKHEIYVLLNAWSRQGHCIVMRSSELPELLHVSDRVIVMHRGRTIATLSTDETTPAELLRAAMGFASNG